jgi:hypothetical protein
LLGAIGGVLLLLGLVLFLMILNVPQRAFAGAFDRDRIRKAIPAARPDTGAESSTHVAKTASHRTGKFDHVGRRVGDGLVGAPDAARRATSRAASASMRAGAWFLGR